MSAPIVHRPAGTQPWLDEEATPAMRLPWRLLGGCGFLIILVIFTVVIFLLGLSREPASTESVAGVVSATATPSATPTSTPTLTPTATDSPSIGGAPTTALPLTPREVFEVLRSFVMMIVERIRTFTPTPEPTLDLGPTFTLTPIEATGEQPSAQIVYRDRVVERVVTSAPRVVYRDRVVEIVVTSPPLYIVVTATPTATLTPTETPTLGPEQTEEPLPTMTPTLGPEQTEEPLPTCEPIFCEVLPPPPALPQGFRK